jgi:quercetin dioxygenase-like cupin family protein
MVVLQHNDGVLDVRYAGDKMTFVTNLAEVLPEVLPQSIVSRKVFVDEQVRVLLFGFAAGESLSEHTAAQPAILHFVQGQARVTLDDEEVSAVAGTFIHMPAHLPHSVYAETDVVMMLTLLK